MTEFLAVITSFICVYYNIKAKPIAWIWSIIACVLYAKVMYDMQLWANFGLQFFFILMSFYGMYEWNFGKKDNKINIDIGYLTKSQIIVLLFLSSCIGFIFVFFLRFYLSFLDIITTFLSLIAQYLLATKKIENWFFWIIANFLYVIMYFSVQLYWSVGLYAVFLVMATIGFWEWKNKLKNNVK
ncbi:MAG: hypothetical protein EAY69_11315 [Cytophagales bacterium]|nr:MAG: hypothetical protein EAY69_11315 [Cytophagales bacterium]